MEKVNVLNTNGELTNHIINTLLDSALEFYKGYEDIVMKTIREVSFYELGEKESMDTVITILTGYCVKEGTHKGNLGVFLYPRNPMIDSGYGDVIIYRANAERHVYHTLAHESFGHAVCGREARLVKKNNELYNRNGISLKDIYSNEEYNIYLNEGAMDFIADSIVRNIGIKVRTSDEYAAAKMSCASIYNYIGRNNFLDALVLNDYSLESHIDNSVEDGFFKKLSELNDIRYNYEDKGHYLTSYVYKKRIQKELKKMA